MRSTLGVAAGVDQFDQQLGLEPVGQHDRLGAAVDGCFAPGGAVA
jgi:hypothetical protein